MSKQNSSAEENTNLIGQSVLFQKQKSFTGHLNFMGQHVIPNLTQLETFKRNQSTFVSITSKMMTPGAYQQQTVTTISNPSIQNNLQPIQNNMPNISQNNQQNG